MARLFWRAAAILMATAGTAAMAQQGDGTEQRFVANVFKPAKVDATPARIASLKAPPGFTVTPFATGLKNARVLTVAPDGTVYLSRRDQGDVLMLKDADGDGRADGPPVTVANRAGAHGIAIHDGRFYLITVKELFVADILADGRLGPLAMLIGDLPDGGQHGNRTIAFGPDGMLYISAGSTCNTCNESNPESATILRASPDGKGRTIFASGLRNTIGFAWDPRTGALWGLDNGIDFLGDDVQPEELNRIERGKQYGWPHVWGAGGIEPHGTPVGDISKEQWRDASTPMVLGYTAHAAPMQMLFYTGGPFPRDYAGDAFATMRGSWNRNPASGYEIVRIHFANGQAKSITPFVTGFLSDGGRTHFARPMGLALARDGALLMADDANGVIYRIAYTGKAAGSPPLQVPAEEMRREWAQGQRVAIAGQRRETATKGTLTVSSPTIPAGGAIPARHSAYAENASPAIGWTAVAGAQSYAIVLEDPDAGSVKPFVHWLAWNIPAGITSLPEGVQAQPRLTAPDGVLQGRTSRGAAGYYGPHPPVGDPPHHYHFQLLALNRMLDVPAGADRDTLLTAAAGHVIARGELVGTYQQTVKPPK